MAAPVDVLVRDGLAALEEYEEFDQAQIDPIVTAHPLPADARQAIEAIKAREIAN